MLNTSVCAPSPEIVGFSNRSTTLTVERPLAATPVLWPTTSAVVLAFPASRVRAIWLGKPLPPRLAIV